MNKNVQELRRKLFESTSTLPDGVYWSDDAKQYIGPRFWLAQYAWLAINQALDAVFIELPPLNSSHGNEADSIYGPSIEQVEDAGFDYGVKACRAAIKSTGLGIKIND